MTTESTTTSRARRTRRLVAALTALAALSVAGCSSGGGKSLTTHNDSSVTTHTKAKKKQKKHNTNTGGLSSNTSSFSSDNESSGDLSSEDTGHSIRKSKNLSTDMHEQMQDTGSIQTTNGSTFTAGSLSFTIPSGWQQGTDDSGNAVLINESDQAKVTVLQDPDYAGGGATQELKSLEQQLADTVTVKNEGTEQTIANGDASASLFVGTINGQDGFAAIVVAIATKSEGYAMLATFDATKADTVADDLDAMINSLTVA